MSTMPEFEMPTDVDPPPRPAPGAPATGATERPAATDAWSEGPVGRGAAARRPGARALDSSRPDAGPDASDALDGRARSRPVWRHLLVAGLIGALMGAVVPAAVQGFERSAAAARVDALRSLATDYLTAIAEQRADDATAMVPLTSGRGSAAVASAALLASARPIEGVEVRLVHVDGDAGAVEVRYSAGGRPVAATVDAELVEGRWRLLTTLAERPNVNTHEPGTELSIGGASISDSRVHLYPGVYTVDVASGPVIRVAVEPFVVDGDPRTPTDVFSTNELVPELQDLAIDYGVATVAACQAAQSCSLSPDALVGSSGHAYVAWSDTAAGTYDIGVPLAVSDGAREEWLEVQVRLRADEEGRPLAWECGLLHEQPGELAPCPPIG